MYRQRLEVLAAWPLGGLPGADGCVKEIRKRHGAVIVVGTEDPKPQMWIDMFRPFNQPDAALSDQRQTIGRSSVCDTACPDPSRYQAMSARHSPSAAERLCL